MTKKTDVTKALRKRYPCTKSSCFYPDTIIWFFVLAVVSDYIERRPSLLKKRAELYMVISWKQKLASE